MSLCPSMGGPVAQRFEFGARPAAKRLELLGEADCWLSGMPECNSARERSFADRGATRIIGNVTTPSSSKGGTDE